MISSTIPWETILFAVAGGFIPALVWLFFWLKEDESPEPRRLLFIAFLAGALAIPAALVLELLWCKGVVKFGFSPSCHFPPQASLATMIDFLPLVAGFAFMEEYAKYFFVSSLLFWRKEFDEPADAIIYLITGALGFAAVENVLYLIRPFDTAILHGFTTSNLRFLGPTLLHTLASAFLGYFIAEAFFQNTLRREIGLLLGFFFSTLLHTLFNLSILMTGGRKIEPALLILISAGIVILFSFEHIKHTIIKNYYAQR